jgi:hypothetical protein
MSISSYKSLKNGDDGDCDCDEYDDSDDDYRDLSCRFS